MGKAYTYRSRPFAGVVVKGPDGKKSVRLSAPLYYAYEVGKLRAGDKVSLVITDQRPLRTEAQNRYWWGVCIPELIKAGMGMGSPLETHEDLARKFLVVKEWKNSKGQTCYVRKSTTELTSGEFATFVSDVEEECGISFPPPQDFSLDTLSTPRPSAIGDGLLSSTHDHKEAKKATPKGRTRRVRADRPPRRSRDSAAARKGGHG